MSPLKRFFEKKTAVTAYHPVKKKRQKAILKQGYAYFADGEKIPATDATILPIRQVKR